MIEPTWLIQTPNGRLDPDPHLRFHYLLLDQLKLKKDEAETLWVDVLRDPFDLDLERILEGVYWTSLVRVDPNDRQVAEEAVDRPHQGLDPLVRVSVQHCCHRLRR